MNYGLKDRVAIITGANNPQGIGAATAYDRTTGVFGAGGKVGFDEQGPFGVSRTVLAAEGQSVDVYARADDGYDFVGWAFTSEAPVVTGAVLSDYRLLSVQDQLELTVTAQHYTDETSRRTETVVTPATATAAGTKEICVYCAGGCGEVAQRYTETIPATGEPDTPPTEPADPNPPSDSGLCKWCGERHTGFWGVIVGFFHSILYFFAHLFGRR